MAITLFAVHVHLDILYTLAIGQMRQKCAVSTVIAQGQVC